VRSISSSAAGTRSAKIHNETAVGIPSDYSNSFDATINDDLNMPEAIALVWKLIKDEKVSREEKIGLLMNWDKVLGLNLNDKSNSKLKIPDDIKEMMEKREELRRQRKFDEADEIRREIEKKGYKVEDTEKGSKLSSLT